MERRFTVALSSALVLHGVLVGVSAWWVSGTPLECPPRATGPEIEVTLLAQDRASTPRAPAEAAAAPASIAGPSHPRAEPVGATHTALPSEEPELLAGDATVVQPGAAESSVVSVDGQGDAAPSGAPGQAARRPIDLGLDGSIVARELRGTHAPPAVRRTGPSFDGWSESILRGAAHNAAPREGSALLILEWDAQGRLASVRSSAESSNADGWRKLAESLKSKLAQRPPAGAGRLRLVYLVKSEVVKPGARSKLPQSENVSTELLKDEYLPPGSALMFGVKADTSPGAHRVVSVTLANSQLL